ncbi:MAG: DNA polymerase III subunit gamma/tau [Burkholderiaceae bacterium]
MSHQVLARKWRPRDFGSLVGQEHVVRALAHALDSGRLHHAYLFTGTRGVGKTTVSRILSRALNCETGVTSMPCGRCGACVSIEQGRFPDYVEMDAASNRGVDEMAQVLEQVVYAPVAGRYKVYMIDEVHMLTGHAFNAMLKTLEEPPPHVVFILATTDPKKVPVTVLSRCLQFNLKNLPAPAIARHLATVLEAEAVPFVASALAQIGRAAAGSMRNALSLVDQAIAYGGGRIEEATVREMLGSVDRRDLERLLAALADGDGRALIAVADDMLAGNAPFERTLLDFAALLQHVALAQIGVTADDEGADDAPARWAPRLAAEDLQVWYQIAIHGAHDLPLAPDPHAGFTMTLLRLLAFRPEVIEPSRPAPRPRALAAGGASVAASAGPTRETAGSVASAGSAREAALAAIGTTRAPARTETRPPADATALRVAPTPARASAAPTRPVAPAPAPALAPAPVRPPIASASPPRSSDPQPEPAGPALDFDGDWTALAATVVARLGRPGLVGQFMHQSELVAHDADGFTVRVPVRPLAEPALLTKVRDVLATHFGRPVRITVEVGAVRGTTVAAVRSREQAEALAQAQSTLEGDTFVRTLIDSFDGTIVPDSIQPIGPPALPGESR